MRVLDLFSGTGSSTQAFKDAGHDVVRVELDTQFEAEVHADIADLMAFELDHLGPFDFVWASPPCTCFSVAALPVGHWKDAEPQTDEAEEALLLVAHTIRLIASLAPKYWVMENPRGMLRSLEVVRGIPITEVTYCQYGLPYMKPTDLFGHLPPSFTGRTCANGDPCHLRSPRTGHDNGVQSLNNAKDRAVVPYNLGKELEESIVVVI